jgi:hypothetical protein
MTKKYKNTTEQYKANHRTNEDGVIERKCTACEDWFTETLEYFYLHNKKHPEKGFSSECKLCVSKRNSKWQQDNPEWTKQNAKQKYENKKPYYNNLARESVRRNPEKIKANQTAWRRRNPDKLKFYGQKHQNHKLTLKEWYECKKFFNFRCACCGITWEENFEKNKQDFHKDHLYHQGRNDLKNCIPLCTSCNTKKHQFTINQWFNENNINYIFERYHQIYLWIRYECKKYIQKKKLRKYNKKAKSE